MRAHSVAAVLFVAMLVPKDGRAQVFQLRTPPPQATAASAPWQISGQPILLQGLVYYPTALTRQFDGNVMMQIGTYENVPLYADATLEPFSVVYVPVARGGMRQYERRREGDLAGTTGSQAPSFPVTPTSALPPASTPSTVGTSGTLLSTSSTPSTPSTSSTSSTSSTQATLGTASVYRPTRVESVPRPRANDGVWIRYDGAKWYSDGEAVPYSPERFTQIGTYRGFPVYRERRGASRDIWVAVVQDGPVAPYARR